MISVCMATYNVAKYLREQIDSILAQLGNDDEIIVSDDGSTDGTVDILLSYNDERIKVYKHTFSGKKDCIGDVVSDNFENALSHAKGDYIFLSDQDDVWIEGKVRTMIDALQTSDVAVSNAWLWSTVDKSECKNKLYEGVNPLKNYFFRDGKYYGCCMALRGNTLKYVLPFPKPLPLHDNWLGLLPEIVGGATFIDAPLIYYRRHSSNVSGKSTNSLFYKIWYRLRLLSLILLRAFSYKMHHGK